MSTQIHQDVSEAVAAHRVQVTEAIVTQQFARQPELVESLGERGRQKYLQEANYQLDYLVESLAMAQPMLFADYVAWARVVAAGRDVAGEDLALNLECLCEALRMALPTAMADMAVEYVRAGRERLARTPATLPTCLIEDQALSPLAHEYLAALLEGDRQRASRLVLSAVESGVSVQDIYLQVFQSSQHEVGRLWQMSRISVAQEHFCTAATQLIMSQLYPYLFSGERTGRTLVATCIAGDLHEIGVRMVSDLFELDGWDTIYLGANTPVPSILQTVREQQADVLAISATIAPHLRSVEELIQQVRAAPDCSEVKIIVGGHPFNVVPQIWRQLGADGCAHDAATSVALANSLVSHKPRKGAP